MKRFALIVLAGLAAAAFVLWWFSDKQVVKRRTEALLDAVTIESSASKIGRGLQAASLDGFLAPTVLLEVPDSEASGLLSRDSVSSGFRYVADQADFTRFELEDVESVDLNDNEATVTGTLKAKAVIRGATRVDGTYRTEFTWRKIDGAWRIAKVSMRPAQ